jgi:hypothetical protein
LVDFYVYKTLVSEFANCPNFCAAVGLHSIVIYGTEPVTEATPAVAAADLTLCIGLGMAFIIFMAVVLVIIKLLRKKGPYPSYGMTPGGKRFKPDAGNTGYRK